MTDYFEVRARDGAAQIGELRLSDLVTMPVVVDDVLADARSLRATERELLDGSNDVLTILSHRSFLAGSADEVRESLPMAYPDVDFLSVVVVTTDTADDLGADVYVLSDTQDFVGHARAFRDNVIETKENLPAGMAFALSGVVTPRNVSPLVYAGVDLVDEKPARVHGLEGFYLTSNGEYFLEDLDELPCAREARRKPASEFTRVDAVDHNANALRAELARVWRRVRDGRFRDYVEGQARHDQWLAVLSCRFDQ